MPYFVRPMQKEDIPQVRLIDRQAFPTMLPPPNFERELRNRMTHFYVVCDSARQADVPDDPEPSAQKSGLVSKLKNWFYPNGSSGLISSPAFRQPQYICGYVGFWILADESHITTIAVRNEVRRQGVGELLLITAIDRSRELFASVVTLEVRVSNTGAQRLYDKYGFNQVGVRKGYYTDNREDAYIMTTGDISSREYRKQIEKLSRSHESRWGEARFSFS